MPRFVNTEENYYLSTSCKVLYTTLKCQKNLMELSNVQFWKHLVSDKLKARKRRHYLLLRNPYDRIVSCFADKFRRSPPRRTPQKDWELTQRLLFPYIGVQKSDPFELVQKKLLAVSFSKFVLVLPCIYKKDMHTYPQYYMANPRLKKKIAWPKLQFKRVYKIESDLEDASNDLNLDFTIRKQQSKHDKAMSFFNNETLQIVNNIYQRDFLFGYQMIDKL